MTITEEELQREFELYASTRGSQGCTSSPSESHLCDQCKIRKTLVESDFFSSIMVSTLLAPQLLPSIIAQFIMAGYALAEKRTLEQMVGDQIPL